MRHPGLALAGAGAAFAGFDYAAHRLGAPAWSTDALLVVPALLAATVLWRRGAAPGAGRWHWRLLSLGPGLWAVGAALWAAQLPLPLDAFFVSFLAPMLAALTVGPRPPRLRRDPLGAADAALATAMVGFLFVRLILLPHGEWHVGSIPTLLVRAEALFLACWALWRGRRTKDPAWRWSYVCVALFALSYGFLGSLAAGWEGDWSRSRGVTDMVWILPFLLLTAAALPARLAPRPFRPEALLLLAGPVPLAIDLLLDVFGPASSAGGHHVHTLLILPLSAVLAVGAAIRLHLGEHAGRRAAAAWQAKVEETQRAARLTALASMSHAMMARLRRASAEVVRCAEAAAPSFRRRGAEVVEYARGSETIVSTLEAALLPLRSDTRSVLDLGPLLEESVRVALESGAPLEVRLDGLGFLDPVVGDPVALRTAFLQLVANASEASPGGVLYIHAERDGGDLVLRFIDDGPGVAAEIRDRIFDPFFTTGPPGESVGLGLTLVHAVARSHRGSIVLEPSAEGAIFALRLPALRAHPGALPHWGAVASATAAALAGAAVFGALSGDSRALMLVGAVSVLVWGLYGLTFHRRARGEEEADITTPPGVTG